MITAIDTNILIDVFADDKTFAEKSLKVLREVEQAGQLIVCEVILAETARYFASLEMLRETFDSIGIVREPVGESACYLAGQRFQEYRRKGGKRDRVLADFLVGAHALVRCSQLVTRDRGFYRTYFSDLTIVDPSV